MAVAGGTRDDLDGGGDGDGVLSGSEDARDAGIAVGNDDEEV